MSAIVKCFFLEPTTFVQHELRRFTFSDEKSCPKRGYGHDATVALERSSGHESVRHCAPESFMTALDDPRWPTRCACGYEFLPADRWQENWLPLYRRSDTGELVELNKAPVGAMWFADWMLPDYAGPDGHCLLVRIPRNPDGSGWHDWMVDRHASNCTLPEDKEHRCCGSPRLPAFADGGQMK